MSSYVAINNIEVDLRNLEKIDEHNVTYPLVRDKDGRNLSQYDYFVQELKELKYRLEKMNLPYTDIVAVGKPGIIVDSEFVQELIKNQLLYLVKAHSQGVMRPWRMYDTASGLKKLNIDKTIYDFIPLNLSLMPYYQLDSGKKVPTCQSLGMKPITAEFNAFVQLSDFIKDINGYDSEGLKFMLDGLEIKTYNEYFTQFLNMEFVEHDAARYTYNTIMIEVPKNRIK